MLPIRPSSPFAAPICVQLPVAKDDGNIELPAVVTTIEMAVNLWTNGDPKLGIKPLQQWGQTARNAKGMKSRLSQYKHIPMFVKFIITNNLPNSRIN